MKSHLALPNLAKSPGTARNAQGLAGRLEKVAKTAIGDAGTASAAAPAELEAGAGLTNTAGREFEILLVSSVVSACQPA